MSELTQNYQILNIIGQALTILSVVFLIYKHFDRADQSIDKTIGMNGTACEYKHRIIDEKFVVMMEGIKGNATDLKQIKENHLFHIEKDISSMSKDIAIILDREERSNPKKI